jgi:hypothetical protein
MHQQRRIQIMEYDIYTVGTPDYKNNFFNKVMRGQPSSTELINKGSVGGTMYAPL